MPSIVDNDCAVHFQPGARVSLLLRMVVLLQVLHLQCECHDCKLKGTINTVMMCRTVVSLECLPELLFVCP